MTTYVMLANWTEQGILRRRTCHVVWTLRRKLSKK